MELLLRLERSNAGYIGDVSVEVQRSHTIGDLVRALHDRLGPEMGDPGAQVSVSRRLLSSDETIESARLLTGDTLVFGPLENDDQRDTTSEFELVVTAGLDAGIRFPLAAGSHDLGRSDRRKFTLNHDPLVSRHAADISVAPDGAIVIQLASEATSALTVDGEVVEVAGVPVSINVGSRIRVGATSLEVRPNVKPPPSKRDSFWQVPFHRTPYFSKVVKGASVPIIHDVPKHPKPQRFNYLMALVPIIMGVAMVTVFGSYRYLLFAGFSPVVFFVNWYDRRRGLGKEFKESKERFQEQLKDRAEKVNELLSDEREQRYEVAPNVVALMERVQHRNRDLWVRDRNAADFLTLRLGVGDIPSLLEVPLPNSGDPEFREMIPEALGETDTLSEVPVTADLVDRGVVGLVGEDDRTSAVAASLIIQATCLHSPEDLVVYAALSHRRSLAYWMKWLPHCRSSSSPIAGSHLATTSEAADHLINELVRIGSLRVANQERDARFPWLLVVLDKHIDPDAEYVARLLDLSPQAGISVLWLSDTLDRVERQAKALLRCRPPNEYSLVEYTAHDRPDQKLDPDELLAEVSEKSARLMAPLRDASSKNAATAIPKVVPLFTALETESLTPEQIATNWEEARKSYALRGPIGLRDGGRPLSLDLVNDGPHGLIGGVTGSGKSELLKSLIAGLMASNPPDRLNFLFIDYKGGASSEPFRNAPHTVGLVSNLNVLKARRALVSLRSELNRRMKILKDKKVKDLEAMLENHPEKAPPSLVIIVDEFASIAKAVDGFVDDIVDIAQRGRSLGIHLILATQRPAGSVNENIKANTNLRISLRMLSGTDSSDVLGVPDAAFIPSPLKGRGFVSLGSGELVSFQSAFTEAPLLAEKGTPEVAVRPFEPAITQTVVTSSALTETLDSDENELGTQLDALVEAVTHIEPTEHLSDIKLPWHDDLSGILPLDDIRDDATRLYGERLPGAQIAIGQADYPSAQQQYPAVVDLSKSGGLVAFGAGRSGKSNLLKVAAMSAALDDSRQGGGNLTIFALDFGSRQLAVLGDLPQCAEIAFGNNLEAVTRVLHTLSIEADRRRTENETTLANTGTSAKFDSVMLLIDGIDTMFKQLEADSSAGMAYYFERAVDLVTNGRQIGIYPIVTATRRAAVKPQILAALGDRIVLRQADANGYADSGLSQTETKDLELPAGRGFINGSRMIQIGSLVSSLDSLSWDTTDPEVEVDDELIEELENVEAEYLRSRMSTLVKTPVTRTLSTTALAASIPLLPTSNLNRPVVGRFDITNDPVELDLTYDDLAITGNPRSGRSFALYTIGYQALETQRDVWVVASPPSPLCDLDNATRIETPDSEQLIDLFHDLAKQEKGLEQLPLLLVDDADLLIEDATPELSQAWVDALPSCRMAAVFFRPPVTGGKLGRLLKRRCRSRVYLRPENASDARSILETMLPPWHPGIPMPPGRGYLSNDGGCHMIQFSDPFRESPTATKADRP